MTTCKDCVAAVLGVCRGDYCEPERVGLIEQAERLAEQGGHTLTSFEKERRHPIWHAHCEHCGREIVYTLDPEPGSPTIYGDLLDTDCTHAPEQPDQEVLVTEG
jgi:hypothetical protein